MVEVSDIDFLAHAQALRVVDVWQEGNETGWVTPRCLYDPTVPVPGTLTYVAPTLLDYEWWMDHGTVGTNTLRFWGEGGSIRNKTYSLAQYLIPRDMTMYRDGSLRATSQTVYKMLPPDYACNHTGRCITPVGNHNCLGVEYESRQNGTHDILLSQYIRGALLYAHDAAEHGIPDHRRVMHGLVALPWGRRSDPWAGRFDIALSWEMVQAIRRDARIWQLWGLPQPGV